MSPNRSEDEEVKGGDRPHLSSDAAPTQEEDLKQYEIEIPTPNRAQKAQMEVDLDNTLNSIVRNLADRDTQLTYQINNEEFPTSLVTYVCAVLTMTGWTKSNLRNIKYLRDESGFTWIWIKFRQYEEDDKFTKLKSATDYNYRFLHGTTPAGNYGIARNANKDHTNAILPQIGSLYNRKYTPMVGLFALAFELNNDDDHDWGEMKNTINSFKDHGKNQIGVAWTGTITGSKKGGKHGAWSAQHQLSNSKDNIVTVGGRVYCIRASKAVVDGIFINISTQPPNNYNPTRPFQIANS